MSDSWSSGSGQRPLKRPNHYRERAIESSVWDSSEIKRAANHEAAHIVIAHVLGLPIRPCGMRINDHGTGESYFQGAGSDDIVERDTYESVIIALLAGAIGSDADPLTSQAAAGDMRRVEEIRSGLPRELRNFNLAELIEETTELVVKHRPCIETLARILLSRMPTPTRRADDPCSRWTPWKVEKYLLKEEIEKVLSNCEE